MFLNVKIFRHKNIFETWKKFLVIKKINIPIQIFNNQYSTTEVINLFGKR